MKKVCILALSCLASSAFAAEAVNPVADMFPDDVMFQLTFDQGTTEADMSNGKPLPIATPKKTEFLEKGLFGKALSQGQLKYDSAGNLDLTKPGTIVFWVAPMTWPDKKPENGKEPGFTAFYGIGANAEYRYEFTIGKTHGQPWGHSNFCTYIQYNNGKFLSTCPGWGNASASQWKNGQWRMVACTWAGGTFTMSIDGKSGSNGAMKKMLTGENKYFLFGANGGTAVDELVIFKRALKEDEIKKLYDETMKVLNEKK